MLWSNSKTSDAYWNSYRILEKQLLKISHSITFDDNQIDVYSSELADIINSACIKIESLAKDIYEEHIFPFQVDRNEIPSSIKKTSKFDYLKWKRDKWKYDYNCLVEIDNKYSISNKRIRIKSNKFHFNKYGSLLFPFCNISASTCKGGAWEYKKIVKDMIYYNDTKLFDVDWCKSYQEIKHNYIQSIPKHGTVKNAVMVLAAFYLLVIYHSCLPIKKIDLTQQIYSNLDFDSELFSCDMCNHLRPPFIIDSKYNEYINEFKLKNERPLQLLEDIDSFPFLIILNEKNYNFLKNIIDEYLQRNSKEFFDIANCKEYTSNVDDLELELYNKIKKYINPPFRINDVCVSFNSGIKNIYDEYSFDTLKYEKSKFSYNNKDVLSTLNVGNIVDVKFLFNDEFEKAKVIELKDDLIKLEINDENHRYEYSAPIANIIYIKINLQ